MFASSQHRSINYQKQQSNNHKIFKFKSDPNYMQGNKKLMTFHIIEASILLADLLLSVLLQFCVFRFYTTSRIFIDTDRWYT
jgi:hypothetical protein